MGSKGAENIQYIRDMRTDFNHKASGGIARHYGTVAIEDLDIKRRAGKPSARKWHI
ncbi:MAG: hypothetical protein QXZ44_00640 [Ferroplasma sp.]